MCIKKKTNVLVYHSLHSKNVIFTIFHREMFQILVKITEYCCKKCPVQNLYGYFKTITAKNINPVTVIYS